MLFLPSFFGHEVYVLTPQQTWIDQHEAKVHPWQTLSNNVDLITFLILGVLITGSLLAALKIKSRPFWQRLGQSIDRATYFAPDIIRISLGASLIAAAHFHSVYGPELPISQFWLNNWLEPFFLVSGIALVVGLFSRLFGLLVALYWLLSFIDQGWYILNYTNYFGEAVALVLISRQNISLDRYIFKGAKPNRYEGWAMPIARWLFGLSLIYAAVNVKFVTAAMSLDVVYRYNLAHDFHISPLLLVLGAGLVEIMIGALYLLGLLQRVNSLIFIGFITASLLFFKESVWPHYLLLGLALGIFLHKPDRLALDSRLFKKSS